MKGCQVFAAIVLAVTAPVTGALLVYQACVWLAYGPPEILLLLKGLAFALAGFLAVVGFVTFCLGLLGARHEKPGREDGG